MAKRRIIRTTEIVLSDTLSEDQYGFGGYWIDLQPASGDIDIDNDGVMSPARTFLVDLSEIASRVLGRQMSMVKGVTLNGLAIGIRPVDDAVDNDESAFFAGKFQFYPDTDHAYKALSLARRMEEHIEGDEIDADSFFLSTETDYKGLRLGWTDDPMPQVRWQTQGWPVGPGGYTYERIFTAYNQMTQVPQENAMFDGRAPEPMTCQWICALASGIGDGDSPPWGGRSADWQSNPLRHSIFPLIRGAVEFSSLDETGAVDDDYTVHVTVDFTVEE